MFRLLFYSPRIAPNTGNAIRTAAATGAELHLVEPLGFDLSEPKLRRAGLDYHDRRLDVTFKPETKVDPGLQRRLAANGLAGAIDSNTGKWSIRSAQ